MQSTKAGDPPKSGTVQTVLGSVSPSELGQTLMHEHVSMKMEFGFTPPPPGDAKNVDHQFKIDTVGWIQQNPYSCRANLCMTEAEEAVMYDVKVFKERGGTTLVENSTIGLERNMAFVEEVAKIPGIHIVAGTGYYVDESQTTAVRAMSEEDLLHRMRTDITVGWEGTGPKCGVIGELGCTWPLTDFEKRVLRAAAKAQAELGVTVMIHPGRDHKAPWEIIRVFQEAGGDLSRTVMAHLDRTFYDNGELLEFAKTGITCEYDLFGIELSYYQLAPNLDMPSDAQRIQRIKALIEGGFEDHIVIAHDIHTNHRLEKYGGHGYSHILRNVLPKMLERGISQDAIDKIMVKNPARLLAIR